MNLSKDIVLRNVKTDPPICKIMNYKMELLKRLFKKLGRDVGAKDGKSKSVRLTTSISVHDLENKKRKAAELLKTHSGLKFFMKVNVYEPENIQKGRLMLLNIAEDLKEYSKVKKAPGGGAAPAQTKDGETTKKPKGMEDLQDMAESQAFVKLDNAAIEDNDNFDDESDRASYLFMELTSTSSFRDIDIDAMLEHTTMDDFMKGLYQKGDTGMQQ